MKLCDNCAAKLDDGNKAVGIKIADLYELCIPCTMAVRSLAWDVLLSRQIDVDEYVGTGKKVKKANSKDPERKGE